MEKSGDSEFDDVLASARELLAWEQELTGWDIPVSSWPPASQADIRNEPRASESTVQESREAVATPEMVAGSIPDSSPVNETELSQVAPTADTCRMCGRSRRQEVPKPRVEPGGVKIAFVGDDDSFSNAVAEGKPFVGEAGALLGKMASAMGLSEDDVYVCGLAQCRTPEGDGAASHCECGTRSELAKKSPQIIVAFGRGATEYLGCLAGDTRRWRGVWAVWEGIPVMPTYQPALLLETPKFKRPVWEDLQQVMKRLASGKSS